MFDAAPEIDRTDANVALQLVVDGQVYADWLTVQATTGIEQLAGTVSLAAVDTSRLYPGRPPIRRGARFAVVMAGQTILTGHVDRTVRKVSVATGHALQVDGRDATADLVDSMAVLDGGGVVGRTLGQVAEDLAAEHGIKVVDNHPGTPVFRSVRVQPGETGNDLLQRLCRMRGVLPISDGQGRLVLARAGDAGKARTVLRLAGDAGNVIDAQLEDDETNRFHTYEVLSQTPENDDHPAAVAQSVRGAAVDGDIRASRITSIDPGDEADAAAAGTLASWTARTRRAQGRRLYVTVRGWLDGGRPWTPNTEAVFETAEIDEASGTYLIAGVGFTRDPGQGTRTALTLVPPDAFEVLATGEPETAAKGRRRKRKKAAAPIDYYSDAPPP